MNAADNRTGRAMEALEALMARLREPGGCPWDREQTFRSLLPHTIEEAYEVVEAVESGDYAELRRELGDVLFHVVFYSRVAQEQGLFSLAEVIEGITEKMILRHPHVFGDVSLNTSGEVLANWESFKQREKALTGSVPAADAPPPSVFDGVSPRLPALMLALKIQQKMAKVGFDWPGEEGVFQKLDEELGEVRRAYDAQNPDAMEEEIGDLLFTLVNLARHLKLDPESALRRSTLKCRDRFRHVETQLATQGRTPGEATLAEMDALWERAKQQANPSASAPIAGGADQGLQVHGGEMCAEGAANPCRPAPLMSHNSR
ncbi:MAG: nucleoside triphosphate pyrophosphohydrolase [Magnetococcus sp. WYHC-3]